MSDRCPKCTHPRGPIGKPKDIEKDYLLVWQCPCECHSATGAANMSDLLAELQRLDAEMSTATWFYAGTIGNSQHVIDSREEGTIADTIRSRVDAEGMAALRNALPAIIAALESARDLRAEVERLQARVDVTTCCEYCDEWDDTTKEPPSWVVCWKCCNKRAAIRDAALARVEALEAKVQKYEERLQIDHCYELNPVRTGDVDNDLIRKEIPPEKRGDFPDLIECQQATIALQDEEIKRLAALLAAKDGP